MNFDLVKLKDLVLMDKDKYPKVIKTERLVLERSNKTDATIVLYSIKLDDEKKEKLEKLF